MKVGTRVLGFPLGSNDCVEEYLQQISDSITSELPTLDFLQDDPVHFQMLRLCVNAHLPYFQGNFPLSSPDCTLQVVDDDIWADFRINNSFKQGFEQNARFNDTISQFRLAIRQEGFGVTANETSASAAFHAATSYTLNG